MISTLVVHIGHSLYQLLEQLIRLHLRHLSRDQIAQSPPLAQLQEHKYTIRRTPIA